MKDLFINIFNHTQYFMNKKISKKMINNYFILLIKEKSKYPSDKTPSET